MKDDKPHPSPEPSSLERLADFARKILAVPKAEVDARIREFRQRRRARKHAHLR